MSTSDSIPPPTRDPAPTCLMARLHRRRAMKSKLSLFALAVLLLAAPAQANLLWTWTGDCVSNQAGSQVIPLCRHAALLVVTTDAYVPGTPYIPQGPTDSTLQTAIYVDDAGASNLNGPFIPDMGWSRNGVFFQFPAESGIAVGSIFIEQIVDFRERPDGGWLFSTQGAAPDCTRGETLGNLECNYFVTGINGTWTRAAVPVPEPSTLALVAIGLVGLVGLYRLTEEKSSRAWRRLRFRRPSATGT